MGFLSLTLAHSHSRSTDSLDDRKDRELSSIERQPQSNSLRLDLELSLRYARDQCQVSGLLLDLHSEQVQECRVRLLLLLLSTTHVRACVADSADNAYDTRVDSNTIPRFIVASLGIVIRACAINQGQLVVQVMADLLPEIARLLRRRPPLMQTMPKSADSTRDEWVGMLLVYVTLHHGYMGAIDSLDSLDQLLLIADSLVNAETRRIELASSTRRMQLSRNRHGFIIPEPSVALAMRFCVQVYWYASVKQRLLEQRRQHRALQYDSDNDSDNTADTNDRNGGGGGGHDHDGASGIDDDDRCQHYSHSNKRRRIEDPTDSIWHSIHRHLATTAATDPRFLANVQLLCSLAASAVCIHCASGTTYISTALAQPAISSLLANLETLVTNDDTRTALWALQTLAILADRWASCNSTPPAASASAATATAAATAAPNSPPSPPQLQSSQSPYRPLLQQQQQPPPPPANASFHNVWNSTWTHLIPLLALATPTVIDGIFQVLTVILERQLIDSSVVVSGQAPALWELRVFEPRSATLDSLRFIASFLRRFELVPSQPNQDLGAVRERLVKYVLSTADADVQHATSQPAPIQPLLQLQQWQNNRDRLECQALVLLTLLQPGIVRLPKTSSSSTTTTDRSYSPFSSPISTTGVTSSASLSTTPDGETIARESLTCCERLLHARTLSSLSLESPPSSTTTTTTECEASCVSEHASIVALEAWRNHEYRVTNVSVPLVARLQETAHFLLSQRATDLLTRLNAIDLRKRKTVARDLSDLFRLLHAVLQHCQLVLLLRAISATQFTLQSLDHLGQLCLAVSDAVHKLSTKDAHQLAPILDGMRATIACALPLIGSSSSSSMLPSHSALVGDLSPIVTALQRLLSDEGGFVRSLGSGAGNGTAMAYATGSGGDSHDSTGGLSSPPPPTDMLSPKWVDADADDDDDSEPSDGDTLFITTQSQRQWTVVCVSLAALVEATPMAPEIRPLAISHLTANVTRATHPSLKLFLLGFLLDILHEPLELRFALAQLEAIVLSPAFIGDVALRCEVLHVLSRISRFLATDELHDAASFRLCSLVLNMCQRHRRDWKTRVAHADCIYHVLSSPPLR